MSSESTPMPFFDAGLSMHVERSRREPSRSVGHDLRSWQRNRMLGYGEPGPGALHGRGPGLEAGRRASADRLLDRRV